MNIEELRRYAIHNAFPPATSLGRAIGRAAFVQADPIRSPARAQDLILRHRVTNYRAGDLEKKYPKLDVEEDMLYAYGFLSRSAYELLHPRPQSELSPVEQAALKLLRDNGVSHPRTLAAALEAKSVENYWGGSSNETTHALERLHRRGLVRVAKRERGIRLYEAAAKVEESSSAAKRYLELVYIAIKIFAPAQQRTVHKALGPVRSALFGHKRLPTDFDALVQSGKIRREKVDGVDYVWPVGRMPRKEVPQVVRILAPFDPLVWDRNRFEHFWGWAYRFEAYTPPKKRIRGYYAMPLLWGEHVIGWANINLNDGKLETDIGFVDGGPKEKAFAQALDAELERMEQFLSVDCS